MYTTFTSFLPFQSPISTGTDVKRHVYGCAKGSQKQELSNTAARLYLTSCSQRKVYLYRLVVLNYD